MKTQKFILALNVVTLAYSVYHIIAEDLFFGVFYTSILCITFCKGVIELRKCKLEIQPNYEN